MEDPLPSASNKLRPSPQKAAEIAAAERAQAAAARAAEQPVAPKGKASLDDRMASLTAALRRARVENAEHSEALADLRAAEIARLDILADALAPVVAQLPKDCDIFDVAVAPGARPRLFIDQIGFIEMDRDRRTYRFLQDTRHGRVTLVESADLDVLVEAATNYIAHRLIEREKALAIDYASGGAAKAIAVTAPKPRDADNKGLRAFSSLGEFLGSAAFFGLVAAIGLWAYRLYGPH